MVWMENKRETTPPKKQKGFQLPLEVIEWLEDEEARTGATLSRIALAAFCAYLVADNKREAMMLAMGVERGDIQFRHVKSFSIEMDIEGLKESIRMITNKEAQKALKADLKLLERRLQKTRSEGR